MMRRYGMSLVAVLLLGGIVPSSMEMVIAQGVEDRKAEADRAFEQGVTALQAGEAQWDTAVQRLERAASLYQQLNLPSQQAGALGNLGVAYRIREDYTASLTYLQQAYTLMKQVKNTSGEWTALQQLALTHRALGNYEQARDLLEAQLELSEQNSNQSWIVSALANLGLVYMDLGEDTKARQTFERQIKLAEAIEDEVLAQRGRNNMALLNVDAASPRSQLDADIAEQERVRAEQLAAGDSIAAGYTSGTLGLLYRQEGRRSSHRKALRALEEYLESTKATQDLRRQRVALHNMGVVLYELKRYGAAEVRLWEAIELGENLQKNLRDTHRISIFDSHLNSYEVQQLTLVAQRRWQEALEVAERGRARAFADLLLTRSQTHSATLSALLTVPPPTLQDLQALARSEQAVLVEYSIMTSSNPDLLIWVIQPSGEISFRQVNLSQQQIPLEDLMQAMQEGIGQRSRGGFEVVPEAPVDPSQALQQLHNILIDPIADLLPPTSKTPVIVAPHADLFLVPFAALINKNGQHLIETHTIITTPSLQILDLIQQRQSQPLEAVQSESTNALIIGNPEIPNFSEPQLQQQKLASLPNAREEAIQIGQILQAPVLLGNAATETIVQQQLPQAHLAHFATHGLLDYGTPDLLEDEVPGAIVLSKDGSHNGLLTSSEILNLQLQADLVVLSACDTGLGRLSGDGVNGLARSFLLAGASNVIVSLWSVPDAPTAALMTEFYRQWQSGLDKAQALRQAMLTTLKTHPDPKDWAAFTLVGSAQ